MTEDETFTDVVAANEDSARRFSLVGVPAFAKRGSAVVTCIDSRIEPLAMLGLEPVTRRRSEQRVRARVTDDRLERPT